MSRLSNYIRKRISHHFTRENEISFTNQVPSIDLLTKKLNEINELGIYLHIPFCQQICPYCPYNKELFQEDVAFQYLETIKKEIDDYASILSGTPITSFYIGGGTPTSMLENGLEEIIDYVYQRLNVHCSVHLETHPNHLTRDNLLTIRALNVKYLSIGVEAFQDHHLSKIQRPYTVQEMKERVRLAVSNDFDCVNVDYMFDLPGQTMAEVEEAATELVNLGVDQAATYPLFGFTYTPMGRTNGHSRNAILTMFRRRQMLKILEDSFYGSGFDRSSVWAFTKKGIDKYCSVTVPMYLGIGASGSTYLKDIFYVNTFSVAEYIRTVRDQRMPIALSIDLTEEMQMAGWLYWRIYETKFRKSDFVKRFQRDFDEKYGYLTNMFYLLGFAKNGADHITLTDRGAYWIHAFEDFFSIDYISKLWGTSKFNPWPEKVVL